MNTAHAKDPNQGYFEIIKNQNCGGEISPIWKKGMTNMNDDTSLIQLIFMGDKYYIQHGENSLGKNEIKRLKDESDEDYKARAIIEFDQYCESRENIKKKFFPQVIKSKRIGW